MHSKDQLKPPYPQTLEFAQIHGDGGKLPNTHASPQPHAGSTGPSSSERSVDTSAAYLSVKRARGETAQRDRQSGAAVGTPMSRWEHGDVLDEPWNGVGEVAAGTTGGERSVRWFKSGNHKSKKDSDRATKGSSKETSSGS